MAEVDKRIDFQNEKGEIFKKSLIYCIFSKTTWSRLHFKLIRGLSIPISIDLVFSDKNSLLPTDFSKYTFQMTKRRSFLPQFLLHCLLFFFDKKSLFSTGTWKFSSFLQNSNKKKKQKTQCT